MGKKRCSDEVSNCSKHLDDLGNDIQIDTYSCNKHNVKESLDAIHHKQTKKKLHGL